MLKASLWPSINCSSSSLLKTKRQQELEGMQVSVMRERDMRENRVQWLGHVPMLSH